MSKARLAPYATSDGMDIELLDFDDPTQGSVRIEPAASGGGFEFSGRTYDFSHPELKWDKLSFRIRVSLDGDELKRILPRTSDPVKDTAVVVSLICPSTKFRHGVKLHPIEEGRWGGDAIVQRLDLKGTVQLRPTLVRTTSIPSGEGEGYGTWVRAIIATGPPATMFVDPPIHVLHGAVDVEWEDFTQSSNPWRRNNDADVFNLEPHGESPRLYLNLRYKQLRPLLDTKARRGVDAGLRDLTATAIAQTVWVQLFMAAAGSLEFDQDTGESELPPSGWRRDLIQRFLPYLYPGMDPELQVRQLGQELHEGGLEPLMAKVGTAAQQMVGTFKMIEAAIRARENTVQFAQEENT